MKKTLDAPMTTGQIKRCGTCSHGSSHFKIVGKTHLHCQHPSEEISGPPTGWDTLRNWFDKGCKEWQSRKDAQKIKSEKRLFLFHREDGFYPLVLPKDTIFDHAMMNPGTIKIVDVLTNKTVWESECAICGGSGRVHATKPDGQNIRLSCHVCNSTQQSK